MAIRFHTWIEIREIDMIGYLLSVHQLPGQPSISEELNHSSQYIATYLYTALY